MEEEGGGGKGKETVIVMEKKKESGGVGVWGVGVGMLMVQVIATGLQLLCKVILTQGTFVFAYLAYRHVVGALCVLPFALYYERGNGKKLSWLALFWLFVVALTGITMAMGLFYYGLADTTATYATNFLNLIPVVTFLLSAILRVEKLRLKTKTGKIKTLCAMICLGGALTITLYKGMSFHIINHHHKVNPPPILKNHKHHWTRGTIFLVCSCLSYGFWFITQAKLLKVFPYKFWATFYICVFATLQQVVIGLCINRSKASWKLEWNLQLVTIFYSGVLATTATFWLISWAITKRGPTYPSMFNPLSLVFIAVTEAIFLGQEINVGSLIGMSLIIIGLYGFLWAKNKEYVKGASLPTTTTTTNGGEMAPALVMSQPQPQPQPSTASVVPEASLTKGTTH